MRSTFLALMFVAVLGAMLPFKADAEGLGLAERRALKEYQEKKFPEIKKQLNAAAGFDVKTTVHWEKLAQPGEAANYMSDEYFTWIFFAPLTDALKQIAKDDMGKAALKDKLKEIVFTYNPDTAPISNYKAGWPFEKGVLTINYKPWVNTGGPDTSYYQERVKGLIEILEEKL